MVMSVRPGLRPSQFSALFSYMLWDIELIFFVYHFILMHVRSSSNAINFRQFLLELCPFWTSNSYKYSVSRIFLRHSLTYWAEILHMTLFYCTTDQVWVSSIFVGVMPLLELRILKIRSFPLFSLTCFDILSAEYLYITLFYCTTDLVRLSSICVNFFRSYAPFGTQNTGNTQFSALFSSILWYIELKF